MKPGPFSSVSHPDDRDVRRNPVVAVLGGLAFGLIQVGLAVAGLALHAVEGPAERCEMCGCKRLSGGACQECEARAAKLDAGDGADASC
jgi:hypothetical protein